MSEMPIRDADGHLTEVAHQVAAGQVVYLTEHGQRLAAIVPADLAATLERDQETLLRIRLAQAGLLANVEPVAEEGPSDEEIADARAEAGRGRPLSEYVSESR